MQLIVYGKEGAQIKAYNNYGQLVRTLLINGKASTVLPLGG